MNRNRTLIIVLVTFAFLVGSFSPLCPAEGDVNITFKEATLSADLSGVPLQDVLEHLSKSQNIWFEVDKSVLDCKVSVYFSDLSVEQGLRRILTGFDYSLEFDRKGRPDGIVIVGEKASAGARRKGLTTPRRVPEPGPDSPGPMGPDLPIEGDEDVSSGFGPYGPPRGTAEAKKDAKKAPPADESADIMSPYGPSGVSLEEQQISKGTKNSSSAAPSVRRGRGELETPEVASPEGPNTASP